VGLFVFPDGITGVNVDHFFAGLDGNLSNDQFLPIWGGCSADNLALGQTYQYCDDEIVSDGVAYALLSGAAQLASAIGISYILIGGERTVTRSKENVIYEIDGKAALEVLQEYLPDSALVDNWGRCILTYGLCFEAPSFMNNEEYILRAVTSMNKADGSIILSTEIPEGTSVWFSSRDKETVTAGLDRMAAQINQELGGDHPKLVLHFDCVARGKMMFRDQEKLANLRRLRQSLGPDAPWAGFYSYGEIGPVSDHNFFHSFSAVVLALG
jgi:hypothetical protein